MFKNKLNKSSFVRDGDIIGNSNVIIKPTPAIITKDRTNAILWNKLGSTAETTNSEIGPDLFENVAVSYVAGKFGNAFDQDDTNTKFLGMADFPAFTTDIGSADMWVNLQGWNMVDGAADDADTHNLWRMTKNSSNNMFVQDQATKFRWQVKIGGVAVIIDSTDSGLDLAASTWQHIAFAWDRTHATKKRVLWIDGVEIISDNTVWDVESAVHPYPYYLGTSATPDKGWKGYIDNIYHWSTYKTDWSQRGIE